MTARGLLLLFLLGITPAHAGTLPEGLITLDGRPAPAIRLADLDGRAIHRADDIAGTLGGPGRHVLCGGDEPVDLQRQPEGRERAHDRQDGRRPRHVVLHGPHAVGGLEVEATRVEGDPLPDDGKLPAPPPAGSARSFTGSTTCSASVSWSRPKVKQAMRMMP